jgi:hypothetical protein
MLYNVSISITFDKNCQLFYINSAIREETNLLLHKL